jgi:uncharacterized membrane protein
VLKKSQNYIIITLTAILIFIGLVFISTVFIPFDFIKPKIDSMVSDGSASFFTLKFYLLLKQIGLIIILLGVLLKIFSQKIKLFFQNFSKHTNDFCKEISQKVSFFFKKEDKSHLIAFFIIIITTILIRLDFINRPIITDEAFTFITFGRKSLLTIISDLSNTNNHILHTILVHISYKIFGISIWAIRLPAFIFGVLTVPLGYITARTFYNKQAALLSMGILSASSILIEFSTNARGYTMICFFSLVIFCLIKYIKENNNTFAWFLFIIFSVSGFFTITLMFIPFCVAILWLFISIISDDSKNIKRDVLRSLFISLLIIIILTLLLYLPAFLKTGNTAFISAISRNLPNSQPWSSFLTDQLKYIKEIWGEWTRDIPIILYLFFEFCFLISLIFHKKIAEYKTNIFIPAIILFIPVQILLKNSFLFTRYWLFLLPLFLITSAAGFSFIIDIVQNKIRFRKSFIVPMISLILSIGLCISVFLSQSIHSSTTGVSGDGENITVYVKEKLHEKDVIVDDGSYRSILKYYFLKYKIPENYLYSNLKDIESNLKNIDDIFVVIKKDQKIEDFLDMKKLPVGIYSEPKILETYNSGYIYELQKLK